MRARCISCVVTTVPLVLFDGAVQAQQPGMPGTQVSTTAYFAFHSDVATNLHDAVYHASRARVAQMPELFRAPREERHDATREGI